jgi:hypothetical protein
MAVRKYSSRSQKTTLTSAITSSSSSITVVSAPALMGGITMTAGQTYTVVIDPDTALEEIVDVYSASTNPVSGNTLAIVRNINGSIAQAHSAGAEVRHMAIGRDYQEANDHAEGTLAAHAATTSAQLRGVISDETGTGSLVFGTSPTIASPTITGTGAIAGVFTGNLTGNVTGAVTGNASTATTLATARDFQILGDVEASAISFNGSGNVSLTTSIATGVIVNADVNASAAIAPTKIAGTAITAADTGTVTSNMIADGAILNADINASAAIDKTKIAGTAITVADSGTVTSAMIADATIVNADISATAAIAKTKLDLGGTITSADLVDGTIVNADINAAAAIALSKLAVDPLARANHTGTQTASTVSDFDTQVRTSRLDQMAAPTAAVALNAQKITGLADPTSAQDAVTLNYITTQKGAVNGLAELDGNGLVPTHHLPALAITTTQVVNSQANMLALTAQIGDVAVRTDVNKSFILTATPATTLGNWQELLTPTDAVLSVDGSTGAISLSGTYLNRTSGQLLGALDANNFKITGLGTPTNNADAATKVYVDTVAGSAAAAAASATAAEAAYDSFDDRYLGAKSTPPTLDNDGNALATGAIYWNSVTNQMFAWTGSAWGSISSTADIYRFRFTAAGGETSESGIDDNGLTLAYIPGKEQVYLNGVLLARTSDYNATNGTSITGLAALAAGDILEVITFTAFELADSIARSLFDAKGDILVATSADTPGKLTVGANDTVLVADSSTATGLKWSAYDPLPSQTGNSGKFLTTNGTATSWGTVSTDPIPQILMLGGM